MTDTSGGIELRLDYAATAFTPPTFLIYRARAGAKVIEAIVGTPDRQQRATTEADIVELAFRYPQKDVTSSTIVIDGIEYEDTDGDGLVEFREGERLQDRLHTWQLIAEVVGVRPEGIRSVHVQQRLYDSIPNLTGAQALQHSFTATCGSTAAVVHELRGHGVLWASIPPRSDPNEVHRHLGGNVYCLFFQGNGRFHRLDPELGFQTILIDINAKTNPFQFVAIPSHLWYQPRNLGEVDLQYFIIHEPAFDPSELLVLEKTECRPEWAFEY